MYGKARKNKEALARERERVFMLMRRHILIIVRLVPVARKWRADVQVFFESFVESSPKAALAFEHASRESMSNCCCKHYSVPNNRKQADSINKTQRSVLAEEGGEM